MQLYLVRHGQTEENVRHVIQGQLPGRLSPLGLEQAEHLGVRFQNVPLDMVISSDLHRAVQTAEAIALPHDLPVVPEPLLREQHYGIHQGKPMESLYGNSGFKGVVRQAQGGETIEDLRRRAETLWGRWQTELVGKTVVAVSHGALLSVLLPAVLSDEGLECRGAVFENGGIASIRGNGEPFRLQAESTGVRVAQ